MDAPARPHPPAIIDARPGGNRLDNDHQGSTHDRPGKENAEPASYSDDDLVTAIRRSEARSREALNEQLGLIAEAETRETAEQAGARSTQTWLRELLNLADSDAKTRVIVARNTTPGNDPTNTTTEPKLPATAEVLRSGEATIEHGRVIADGIAKLPPSISPEQRAEADATLADHARTTSPRHLRTLADHLRYRWDQDGALQDEQHQLEHRELHITTNRDGTTRLNGRLDRETGAKLRATLEPLAAPHPGTDGTRDPRSPAQRNADAFETMLNTALAGDNTTTSGTPPRITVTIDYDDLRQRSTSNPAFGGGTLEPGGEPITAANARRIACDADILPILLGGDSQPLDIGRSRRTAPADLRAALLARDGRCAFPGCDQPPGTPEAHHMRHWADGGSTALHNMVMLCGHHHRTVHKQHWRIHLQDGNPFFTPPSTVEGKQHAIRGERSIHRLVRNNAGYETLRQPGTPEAG